MEWEELLPEFPGGSEALDAALSFLEPFEPETPEDGEWGECSRAYALERLMDAVSTFLWNLEKIGEAPTIADTKAYLRRVERQARDLEKTLSGMSKWLIGPLFDVLDSTKPYDKDPLYQAANGNDLLAPWDFDSHGCPRWQKKLDALSRLAGKAAENMEDVSRGGPLNMASLYIGNPKEQLVLGCERILLEFRKDCGLSKDGPLSRFTMAVHRLATGDEGSGWPDAIRQIAKWRREFSNPFWEEWSSIEAERFRLGEEFGFLPLGPLPDGIPEVDSLKKRIDTLTTAEHKLTHGPHKMREFHKANRGENPMLPVGVPPVELKP